MIKKGDNPYNNRVLVNYDDKTINFIPIGYKSKKKYFTIFFINLCCVFGYFSLIPYLLGSVMLNPGINQVFYMLFALFLPLSISFYIVNKYYNNPEWRKHYYPEFNYKMIRFLRFGRIKKCKLEKANIHDKTFIIPHFQNVMFNYKATGDFKEIESIKISNIFIADPFKWFCLIKFKKLPQKGYMEIEYL